MRKSVLGGLSANTMLTVQKVKMNSQNGEFSFEDDSFEPRNMQDLNFNQRVDAHSPRIPSEVKGQNKDAHGKLNREGNI